MRLMSRQELRCKLEKEVINSLTLNEIKKIEKELYPYFKHVIEEENAKLKAHLLMNGKFELLEEMSKEEERLLKEGLGSTIADIGITAGQMIGGGVGQVAGIAGLVKYVPEFQNNIDKSFLEWFGPFISLFFSAQALLFPMPAVASLKGILTGFVSGVKGILKGTGGILAKGVSALFAKGSGFIAKMIELLKSAIAGITSAAAKGGPTVTKIEGKLGGSGVLSGALKALEKAGEEVVKRFNVIKEGLIKYGSKLSPSNIKEILKKAFQTSKDKLDDAANFVKGSKTAAAAEGKSLASHMTNKAITAAKNKFSSIVGSSFKKINEWLVSFMTKHPEILSKFVNQKMVSNSGITYVFKGMDDGGRFILETNKEGIKAAKELVKQSGKSAKPLGKAQKAAEIQKGADQFTNVSISAAQFFSTYGHMWFGVAKTGVKKATGVAMSEFDQFLIYLTHLYPPKQAAVDMARIIAASQGGGFDDFDKDSYMSPVKSKPQESEEKEKENIEEIRRLNSLIYHSRRNAQIIRERKIINLI